MSRDKVTANCRALSSIVPSVHTDNITMGGAAYYVQLTNPILRLSIALYRTLRILVDLPMKRRKGIVSFVVRLGIGVAAAVTGVVLAIAVQVAGTIFFGLPSACLPWIVIGFAAVGFVCGVIIGARKVGVSQGSLGASEGGGPSVPIEDSRVASGNPYQSPGATEAFSPPGQRSITALLHAACDGCAWFLMVSVISAIAVYFIAGWPGAASPGGCALRVFVVLLAATIPAILAVISSLSKTRPR